MKFAQGDFISSRKKEMCMAILNSQILRTSEYKRFQISTKVLANSTCNLPASAEK